MPVAILASVLAVAGAITIMSAHRPNSTWLVHSPLSRLANLVCTTFLDSVASVSGVMNSIASGVMITFTSAPFLINSRTRKAAL